MNVVYNLFDFNHFQKEMEDLIMFIFKVLNLTALLFQS